MNGDSPFDPANTYSGTLPTLPAAGLSVLDPRFPMRLKEPARTFWDLIAEWPDRETVVSQTIRATQDGDGEERFVQPLPPLPPEPAPGTPVPYPTLTQAALDDEWDTQTQEAVLAGTAPGRRRAANGRFISAGGDD